MNSHHRLKLAHIIPDEEIRRILQRYLKIWDGYHTKHGKNVAVYPQAID